MYPVFTWRFILFSLSSQILISKVFDRQDISETEHFRDRTSQRLQNISETGHFRDRTFQRQDISETGHFRDRTFHRQDISQTGYFTDRTFQRQDISETGHFRDRTFHDNACHDNFTYEVSIFKFVFLKIDCLNFKLELLYEKNAL